MPFSTTNSERITSNRLLVASFLLPTTISFQVTREKDGKFRANSLKSIPSPLAASSQSASVQQQPNAPQDQPNKQAHQPSAGANRSDMRKGPLGGTSLMSSNVRPPTTTITPSQNQPSEHSYFSVVSADHQAQQASQAVHPQWLGPVHPFDSRVASPSILAQPPERPKTPAPLFPSLAAPVLNQPRSRSFRGTPGGGGAGGAGLGLSTGPNEGNHPPVINIKKSQPSRRTSLDSAKVFADAAWSVESGHGGNGGLYNAINSIDSQLTKRVFVGTLGMATDSLTDRTRGDIKAELAVNHGSIPVFVHDDDYDGHYHHFCKQILWPIFHYVLPDNLGSKNFEEGSWKHYVAVNRAFADTLVENYVHGDVIWVNDYHLMLVPNMIRERLPDASIGFFLHIPFPSSEIFRCLHVRKEVLEGLLGADLLGFQTYSFARHFLQTCTRILSVESSPRGIQLENTVVNVGIFPIGIDRTTLNIKRKDPEVDEWLQLLREKYSGKKLIVARDKLDHVKGVRQKMLAFERFLNLYPEWVGKVVMIQVALSTSEQNEVQGQVSDVVTRVNSKFSNLSYSPIVFLYQDITFSQYLALLTAADVCLITSLRDGMNLTSHEYVVCQEESKNPLVLSEFAGTYGSLGACLRVNPWNYREVANAIFEALTMESEEKAHRWGELNKHVSTNTAQYWAKSFVTELDKVHFDVARRYSIHIPLLNAPTVLPSYQSSQKRLLFLDYDGTLRTHDRQYHARPKNLIPNSRAVKIVTELAQDPRNIVYIMSGRSRESLDYIFDGVDNLGMCAEGGCFLKHRGSTTWEDQVPQIDMQWRKKVKEMFEYYQERTPGSEIEEKSVAVIWHYKNADNPTYGVWQARECQNHIQEALGSIYPIHATVGRKCLEVMPRDVSKALAAKIILDRIARETGSPDFVLCLGDDRTDEDMFEFCNGLIEPTGSNSGSPLLREHDNGILVSPLLQPTIADLPEPTAGTALTPGACKGTLPADHVYTCTVGPKSSEAHWFVSGVSSVLQILEKLAVSTPATVAQ